MVKSWTTVTVIFQLHFDFPVHGPPKHSLKMVKVKTTTTVTNREEFDQRLLVCLVS
jgi:hypothetical protein